MQVLATLALLNGASAAVVSQDTLVRRRAKTGVNIGFLQPEDDIVPVSELVTSSELETETGVKKEFPYYHTSQELQSEALRLVKSCKHGASIKTLTDRGVSIDVVTIDSKKPNPANRVFLLFGEHSRELISPESGLFFLKALCGEVSLASDITNVEKVLEDNTFQMVLNGNPRSRRIVESGQYCVRENPSGVDLNRNWDEMWKGTTNNRADTNPGPHPFSEPETRIFKQLVTEFKPTTFLTVHSGTKGMYMPWAYDMHHLAARNEPAMMQILKLLDAKHCKCPFGAAGKEVGYSCPGTSLDWVYDQMNTPYSFAFEIYGSPEENEDLENRWKEKIKSGAVSLLQEGHHLAHSHFSDIYRQHASDFVHLRCNEEESLQAQRNDQCFSMFNPDTKERYEEAVQNWATAYLEMAHHIREQISANQTAATAAAAAAAVAAPPGKLLA